MIASIIPGWLLPLTILISWTALMVVSNGGPYLKSLKFEVIKSAQWCNYEDRAATPSWSRLSDEECMFRFNETRKQAVEAVSGRQNGFVFFKHIHKAGGTSLCQIAQTNMHAEDVPLPYREDWTTNCVPFETFFVPPPGYYLGPAADLNDETSVDDPWFGAACFFGFLSVPQLRALPSHFNPLNFVASEGPMPDAIPLDIPVAYLTMLRDPLDRTLSSYHWWQYMVDVMPEAPTECDVYAVPDKNASFYEWLKFYPDNWMTREFAGISTLFRKNSKGEVFDLTEADLMKAKQRLGYFSAVLLVEKPVSSQLLLERIFGWRNANLSQYHALGHR
jgi:hypothetical protein